ncbi:MAG: mechanosensitive ion channel family protein [Spirochaetaceae bacterium]|jgi:small-conductance mechanosensitive channel|nr:mechanosensitive ion channel family protein [Spirochaetaceae bacterium]
MGKIVDFFSSAYNSVINVITNDENKINIFVRLGIALIVIVVLILLIRGTWRMSSALREKMYAWGKKRLRPLCFKKVTLLAPQQLMSFLSFIITILKWLVAAFLFFITIPIIFSLFEATQGLSSKLFGYILTPIKNFGIALINYIPNLITIIIILVISRYILRATKFFATQIGKKNIVIPGFYADWAEPTFNIMRVIIIAFTVAIIYPHLPNSDSGAFQGISVLVGLIFSLGSSALIGNIVAGLVMTYMRPFKVGDRIKINDITGFVVERSPMVTRIRTHKNEYVTFPNSMVLNTSVTNYYFSTLPGQDGLVVHADVTMGYDVPWRTVHDILITAALKSEFILKEPAPFVNQLKLDDFYCWYEINAYTKDVHLLPKVYTELYKNLQDGFVEAGISLYAPHYQVQKRAEEI